MQSENAEIISKMIELSSHSTSNPAGPSQYGALAALTGPQDFVEENARSVRSTPKLLLSARSEHPWV